MILWRKTDNYPFLSFYSDPRFPPFLLYVRRKSGVTFVRRCFRNAGACKGSLKPRLCRGATTTGRSNAVFWCSYNFMLHRIGVS